MKAITQFIGLMFLAGSCVANELTGTIVPPFPTGWKDHGGACLDGCNYNIGVLEKPGQLILYMGKSAPRVDPKKARWLVTDQMPFPKTPTGFEVVYSLCERNREPDETIIAVVKTIEAEWYTTVKLAYRANLSTGRFEKTTTKGVRCLNDGWGV